MVTDDLNGHPFYAKFIGGPFDGLEIAARQSPVPWVLYCEAPAPLRERPPGDKLKFTVCEEGIIHRYERVSYNDGFSWVFEYSYHTVNA